jgi:hypothetical protein
MKSMERAAQDPIVVPTDKILVFRQTPSSRHFEPKFNDELTFRNGPVFGNSGLCIEAQLGGNSKRSAVFRVEPGKTRELRDYLNVLLGEVAT